VGVKAGAAGRVWAQITTAQANDRNRTVFLTASG